MGRMASQITSQTIVYSIVYSGADQRKHQSSNASLAIVRGIHRWPVNSPHKGPVTRKMFPFEDVIMYVRASEVAVFHPPCKHIHKCRPLWNHSFWRTLFAIEDCSFIGVLFIIFNSTPPPTTVHIPNNSPSTKSKLKWTSRLNYKKMFFHKGDWCHKGFRSCRRYGIPYLVNTDIWSKVI